MKEELITIYESFVVLDYSVNILNKDLKNVQKCRELIKFSSDASDVCEDYLRLSKEEIGEIYKNTSDILNTLLDNINVLKQIPKTHWYTAAIAFIIDAYTTNESLEESIKLYDNSICSLLSENQETSDVLVTIEESQDNAIARASFIKSLLNRNEEFGILVPEIQKIRLPNAGNKEKKETSVTEKEKKEEIEEKTEEVGEKEQHRKTIFEVLRANRGE